MQSQGWEAETYRLARSLMAIAYEATEVPPERHDDPRARLRRESLAAVLHLTEGTRRRSPPRPSLERSLGALGEVGQAIDDCARQGHLSPSLERSLRALQAEASTVLSSTLQALREPRR